MVSNSDTGGVVIDSRWAQAHGVGVGSQVKLFTATGPDSFTYKANDGQLDSNIVTVSLNVSPV